MVKWFKRGDSGPDAEPEPWWRGPEEGEASADEVSVEPDAAGNVETSDAREDAESAASDVTPEAAAVDDAAEPAEPEVTPEAVEPVETGEAEAVSDEPSPARAAAGGAFVAGLAGRFKRKKAESPAASIEEPAPAETPAVEIPASQAEPADTEVPVDQPAAPEVEEVAPEFPAEPAPAVSMPERRPGLFGGLKSKLSRSKEPAETVEPLVPPGTEAVPGPSGGVDSEVAAVTGGAAAAGAIGVAAEGSEPEAVVESALEAAPVEAPSGAEAPEGVPGEAPATVVFPAAEGGVPVEGQLALPPVEPVFVVPAPPPPATLIAGSALVAVVSRGPDPTTPPLSMIPNVTGLPQEEALDGLQELGVATQIVLAYSSEVKVGRVIAQYPTPGVPFPETQSAVLVVSRGPAAVPHVVVLPSLAGLTEDEATREIKQLGLEPFTVDAHDPEIEAGTVLSQVPSPESLAVAPVERRALWPWILGAAAIVLLVFGGFLLWRLNATYPVPSVVGQTQLTAQQTVEDAGFSVGSIIASPVAGVPRGAVASQIPAANSQAKLRSSVSLVVSSGEPLVQIPDVIGKAESEATTDLANVDLTTEVIRAYDATVPAGNVVSQFPVAGDQVLPNTVVGLVVSRGRPPAIGATVPNVTGLTQSKATSAVSKAKLTSQVFTVPSASVSSGKVVGQLPPPGSLVAKSSQVYLFVSRGRVSGTTTLTASVPNLIGQTQIQAITNINSAGLIAVVSQAYSSAIPPGIVYAQVPQPGAVVSRETQVGIIVSQGPAPMQ
jgi:beta-lactam-binding protein with PASTA domain